MPRVRVWNLAACSRLMVIAAIAFLLTGVSVAQEPASPPTATIDFVKDVKPIIEQHCLKCHGPEKEEDFRIDDRSAAMDYIIPNDADSSQMYTVLFSDDEEERMPPPEEGDPLDAATIQIIKVWIDQGAAWPDGVEFTLPPEEVGAAAINSTGADSNQVGETSQENQSASSNQLQSADNPDASKPADVDNKSQAQPDSQTQSQPKPVAPKEFSIWNAIGSLHPALLHIPIGLLIAAGLFAIIGFRGNFVMSDCAYYCLWLGTFGAILACVTGWFFSPMEGRGTVSTVQDLWNQGHPVFWHRTTALVATVLAFLLCLFAKSARARDPDDGFLWKLGAVILAIGIGIVGHNGGVLTHGQNLYKDLIGVIEQSTGWNIDGSSDLPQKAVPNSPKQNDKNGQTSTGDDGGSAKDAEKDAANDAANDNSKPAAIQ